MIIYAKQVPPEHQESPLYLFEEWPENVYVFGNRHFNQHAKRLEEIRAALADLADTWEELNDGGHAYYASWREALNDLIPPEDAEREYTRTERLELAKLAAQFEWCSSSAENSILCAVLELVTGQEWEEGTLRGCCQGDWQEIIYPAAYGREWLDQFEAEYFNTGTEWIIHDGNEAPETPEDISGYSVYCYGWNHDLIRQEIADAAGCSPENIILYEFTGWSRSASYMEVSA